MVLTPSMCSCKVPVLVLATLAMVAPLLHGHGVMTRIASPPPGTVVHVIAHALEDSKLEAIEAADLSSLPQSAWGIISKLTQIRYLKLGPRRDLLAYTPDFFEAVSRLTTLRILDVRRVHGLAHKQVALITRLKELQELDISFVGLDPISPLELSPKDVASFLMGLKALRAIDLRGIKIEGEVPDTIRHPNLKMVHLGLRVRSDAVSSWFAALPVEELSLYYMTIAETVWDVVASNNSLIRLGLERCESVDQARLARVVPRLEVLSLRGVTVKSDSFIEACLVQAQKLHALDISYPISIDSTTQRRSPTESWYALTTRSAETLAKLPALQTLVARGHRFIDDEALTILAESVSLHDLDIRSCEEWTPVGLVTLVSKRPLRKLDVSGGSWKGARSPFDAKCLKAVADAGCIEELIVEYTGSVHLGADDDIKPVGTLRRFRALRCDWLNAKVCAWLADCRQLREADLSSSQSLATGDLEHFGRAKSLTILHINMCPQLTDETVAVVSKIDTLRVLFMKRVPVNEEALVELSAKLGARGGTIVR